MSDEPAYHLDLNGLGDEAETPTEASRGRRWIGVRFDCCGVYVRVYRNRAGTAYEGRCPRCLRQVRARIGPEGIEARFFAAQ